MRTQVGIIGAGPAGLFLSLLLQRAGVDCVVLESRSRDYVESRVRAGVLEQGTVALMDDLGVAERLHREGMPDPRLDIRFNGNIIHIDLPMLTPGRMVTVYGQQEIVKDLIAARLKRGGSILFETEAAGLSGLDTGKPVIHFKHAGKDETLVCDVIAGCDGFHGVCRPAIPESVLTIYDREFPFGWLGILSESKPFTEMSYANHERGFALASRRSPRLSRLYVQCTPDDDVADWPDARIWDELHTRLDDPTRTELEEGRILQKAIAPCRSFVSAPMQYGRCYLTGDAAHIVPPTGAKGLNLAVADIRVLSRALIEFFKTGATARLERYSQTCLKRIWKVVRYSTYMTTLLHRFPQQSLFDRQIQLAELEYLLNSPAARTTIAENYVGLPFEED
jgi:p-hydroxybenzoate 3-monooxygenase